MIYRFSERFDWLELTCAVEDGAVVSASFGAGEETPNPTREAQDLWSAVRAQLEEYVMGRRQAFDLPLRYSGTPFQTRVWDALRDIPYGETRTYGELAEYIGFPKAARAVGGACHANHIAVIIPCHRVVGSSGSLTGFGGGIEVKERLLKLEGAIK